MTQPSGSISGVYNNFVTINCCPSVAELSQLTVNDIQLNYNKPIIKKI